MNHTVFKELLTLSASGELDAEGASELERHLHTCAECRAELREMKQMIALTRSARIEVTDALLREARAALHAELVRAASRDTVGERVLGVIRGVFTLPKFKTAMAGAVMTAFGVLIGYALFSPGRAPEDQAAVVRDTSIAPSVVSRTADGSAVLSVIRETTRTENIRIVHAQDADGIVEFVFDAVTPVRISGRVGDKQVQRLLARALVDESNAGVRLRAMSLISSEAENASSLDAETKAALLAALKTDDNPAVRQQAVTALQPFSGDVQVQRALCYALLHDRNAGVRIAAVNTIAAASVGGRTIDQSVLKTLEEKVQYDKNIFIRNQSRNVLEEASRL